MEEKQTTEEVQMTEEVQTTEEAQTTEEKQSAEEIPTMTKEELEAELRSVHSKVTLGNILVYGGGAAMIIMCCLKNVPWFIFFLVILFVGGIVWSKNAGKEKKLLSDHLIRDVLKEVLGDHVDYNPWGHISPGSMVFPFSYNIKGGSDHIKTVYNGLNIELGDVELIDESDVVDEEGNTKKERATVFHGQWLICDFGKELAGEVYISEWTKKDRRSMKSNVAMDNEQFSKRFCVRADHPEEAYYILTPHMMEYISSMADKSGGTVYMSFLREGKMHVAVQTGRDFFELGKSRIDVDELRRKFMGELLWFTEVVDTLRVEDNLYKKGTNV
ncbi:MAG: DUF3137 domain-containing protein [Eubacteriales bacterium]